MFSIVSRHVKFGATIITDKWNAYVCLRNQYRHYTSRKQHIGAGLYVETYFVASVDGFVVPIHSNTIEGMFSHFRSEWHQSKGWPRESVQFICDEFTFRSLNVSLTVPFKPV